MQFPLLQIASLAAAAPLSPAMEPVPEITVQVAGEAAPQAPAPQAETPPATDPATTEGESADAGDIIIVTGEGFEAAPGDPLEQINAQTFEISQSVDRALVAPIADAYQQALPGPLRSGLRNFLQNLLEPVNFINGLLQLKPDLAFAALGRFVINSTVGIGGLIDVAKSEPIGLTFRRNGFSNTLGYYGVDEGAFLVLPLVGATTVRDLIGSTLDQALVPFLIGPPLNTPYYGVPAYTVNSLEFRNEFDGRLAQINASDDPYAAMRASYLCEREADIADLRGDPLPDCRLEVLLAEEVELEEDAAGEDAPADEAVPAEASAETRVEP